MRCRKHYTDLSSIVGVCGSCLRERLISLIAAQQNSQLQAQTLEDKLVFPRSVSPYISRPKSDISGYSNGPVNGQRNGDRNRHHSVSDQMFFRTPQVGPIAGDYNPYLKKKKKKQHSFIRFSLIWNLFRSKKGNEYSDSVSYSNPRVSVSNGSCGGGDAATSSMSSPSWFSNIRYGTGSRKKQPFSFNEPSTAMRKVYCPDRGMSPARYSDYGGPEDEFHDASSGYESCESRKQTPWRTPAHSSVRRGGGGAGMNVSGLTFCLSPLVRASPCRNWNQKGMSTVAEGGDIRAPVKPHLSNTKSFCANRSRKLADFGRFDSNLYMLKLKYSVITDLPSISI
ncbi:uncharacterized protein [Rutidosis leptorrhynchoides]|uniref:uncharacterized protein n=1 Tax=Rutidosis leptorrhynchoides TaxID=125765 RepID=UPI003A993F2D